mmetsp:Transcript_17529/g.43685  ORF Transcript_17529/g.43685 Transcript_17529/m.43685 type:complete len:201 (+) Transcript_17529:1709-2311(+)
MRRAAPEPRPRFRGSAAAGRNGRRRPSTTTRHPSNWRRSLLPRVPSSDRRRVCEARLRKQALRAVAIVVVPRLAPRQIQVQPPPLLLRVVVLQAEPGRHLQQVTPQTVLAPLRTGCGGTRRRSSRCRKRKKRVTPTRDCNQIRSAKRRCTSGAKAQAPQPRPPRTRTPGRTPFLRPGVVATEDGGARRRRKRNASTIWTT